MRERFGLRFPILDSDELDPPRQPRRVVFLLLSRCRDGSAGSTPQVAHARFRTFRASDRPSEVQAHLAQGRIQAALKSFQLALNYMRERYYQVPVLADARSGPAFA